MKGTNLGLRPLPAPEPVRRLRLVRAGRQLELPLFSALPHGYAPPAGPRLPSRRALWLLATTVLELYGGHRTARQRRQLLGHELYAKFAEPPAIPRKYVLRSVHPCMPAAGVLELCGTVVHNGRTLALAARFEFRTRWLCTVFDLIGESSARAQPTRVS